MFADAPSKGELDAHTVTELPSSKGKSPQHIWTPNGPPTGSSNGGQRTAYSSAPSNPCQTGASTAPLGISTQSASFGSPPIEPPLRLSSPAQSASPPGVPVDSKVPVSAASTPRPLSIPPAADPDSHHAAARAGPRRSLDGGMRIAGGPPGQAITMSEVGSQSVAHTLPPSYDLYPV